MRELLASLREALDQGTPCVLCSVVETRGSTPQKAGAAMGAFPDGRQLGTLGGGCVEAEVRRRALAALADGATPPQVFEFCLDDNYGWDDGLICGGRMRILVDPLRPPLAAESNAYLIALRRRIDAGLGCTEAIVCDAEAAGRPIGTRWLFDADGLLLGQRGGVPNPDAIAAVRPLFPRPRPYARSGVAYLPILPRISLFIVGGGHVGQAVAKLAADVDFDIWVLDDRDAFASPQHFPSASRRFVGDIGQTLLRLAPEIGPNVYALIVTRGHAHDEEALFRLAPTQAGYVGMIGSKRKIKLIFADLLARGIAAETLDRVHAPLGFAIGSQTVPEIAVSIVAELIACRNLGRSIPQEQRHR